MSHTIFEQKTLTVADWIERLQALPPEAPVFLYPKYHTPINKFTKKRLRDVSNIVLCESYGTQVWVGYVNDWGHNQGDMRPDYVTDDYGDVYEKLPDGEPHVAILF